ncbi:helix-turn-helix domain-containing protein [uncultured Draconibacterium sp.]|uniref:helix-turn-helix domain-containing protein n=1 Tax=uncultured Draconibacterium sp. TaxID=1573823 RepID=UPI0025E96203|nr:helix-turn-helix domain-containing protein [uncultured Draconibacterium sp.]
MPTEIVTTDDLREFKLDLVDEIKKILDEYHGLPTKKWLKSDEVKRLLGISSSTLQNLRVRGTLPYTKLGGVIFYESEKIQKALQNNSVQNGISLGRRK